jgi:hypothetical protein
MARTRTRLEPPSFPALSPAQEQAIELLLQGKTATDVATTLQLPPDEVQRWRHEHPVFRAMLNRQRRILWEETQERLRALVPRAIEVLEQAMAQGSVRAAVEILKVVQLHGRVPPPSGPEDPHLIVWQQAEQWAELEMQRDGPDDEGKLWDDQVRQRLTLTHHRAGKLLSQWTTNGSTPTTES